MGYSAFIVQSLNFVHVLLSPVEIITGKVSGNYECIDSKNEPRVPIIEEYNLIPDKLLAILIIQLTKT